VSWRYSDNTTGFAMMQIDATLVTRPVRKVGIALLGIVFSWHPWRLRFECEKIGRSISSVQRQRINQTQHRHIVIREQKSSSPGMRGNPLAKVAASITKVSPPKS
jgi:hypothetical protein